MRQPTKWILRPGKAPIVPKAAKPESQADFLARQTKAAPKRQAEIKPRRMSPKFGADRRRAFLEAYRRGGDAQGAAKAVMVPWSAVRRTLQADAAFRADYAAAKTEAHTERFRLALQAAVAELGADETAVLISALETVRRHRPLAMRLRDRRLALETHGKNGPAAAAQLVVDEILIGAL